jgi:hypothetical protein
MSGNLAFVLPVEGRMIDEVKNALLEQFGHCRDTAIESPLLSGNSDY